MVFGIGMLVVAVDGATVGEAEVVVDVASDDASAKTATSTCLVDDVSLAFSCSNLTCMAFAFARSGCADNNMATTIGARLTIWEHY